MKTFTWKLFALICALFITSISFAQLKFGDKTTVGQTLVLDNSTGVATVNLSFNTDQALSSAVWNETNSNFDISIKKGQTNKGFQVNVYDEAGSAVVNSDFRCRNYGSYENPAHVESIASLQAILDAYAVNDAATSTSKQNPAHCLFDIAADNQAFGAYPGKYKRVEYGFYIDFSGKIVENDITFDIETYDAGNTEQTASYELTVYIGGTAESNLIATVPNFYVTGSGVKHVSLATDAGLTPDRFTISKVYFFLKTTGTGTAIADNVFDPTIVIDNVIAKYNPPAWIKPAAGITANSTLSTLLRGNAGEETTFAIPLQTKARLSSLKITNDLQDNTKTPLLTFLAEGALKANDGSGNYTVDVPYTYVAGTFDGEKWSKASITVAAPAEGSVNDDMMFYFKATPAVADIARIELDCGTRIWYDMTIADVNTIFKKDIAYVTYAKTMDVSATQPENDPIIQMLNADKYVNLSVIQVTNVDTTLDLSGYDAVVVQESFDSKANILKPGGSLGMASIPVPFIFNKAYSMRDTRGFTNGVAGSGGETANTTYLRVNSTGQASDLFKGITLVGDSVQIFKSTADDLGAAGGTKALQYAANVVITAENTLLASGVADPATATVCINDIPAGSTIGSETLKARMIAMAMNFGAISKDAGTNITNAGLTLWRNAVYSAAGIDIPTTGFTNSTAIASITASAGIINLSADATKAQLVLPAGTTTADLTVTTVESGATVQLPAINVTNGGYETYQIVVTAPVAGVSSTVQLDVHTQAEGEILYLSADSKGVRSAAKAYDYKVFDMLREAGYSVTFAKKGSIYEYTADGDVPFDYTPYAGMVVSGGESSSNVNDYAKRNYPIPCVSMQNDGPKNNKWGWVNDKKTGVEYKSTKSYDVTTAQIKITNNQHPITAGYAVDQMIKWSLGTADSTDWSGKEIKSYGLNDSIPEAIPLATIPADGSLLTTMWAIPAGTSVRSMDGTYSSYKRVTTSSNVVLLYLFNDGLLYASPDFGTLLTKSLDWAINGGSSSSVKKVAYVTYAKEMDATAVQPDNDPVIQMMSKDENFQIDVKVVTADAAVDLSGYDMAVVQEGFSSGSAILKPTGSMGLANISIPFIYNKAYALQSGKAVTSGGGSSTEIAGTAITVDAANQSNALFSGITFADNAFTVFNTTAADAGGIGSKALNYTYGITISNTATLLGTGAEVTDVTNTVFVNDIPAGTTIGDQTTKARMITMGQNFGAICATGGYNMTDENLTMWRNAFYLLAGFDVPTDLYVLEGRPAEKSNDATLSALSVSVGGTAMEMSPAFMPTVTEYNVSVPYGTTSVDVAATTNDANATVSGTGATTLSGESTQVPLTVTAEDGTTATYTITVTVLTGISEYGTNYKVYPNPTTGILNVSGDEIKAVEIYNLSGSLLKAHAISANQVDVSNLARGSYMIKITGKSNDVSILKFNKK